MGKGRDWNVDLIPKFLMSNGMFEALTFSSLLLLVMQTSDVSTNKCSKMCALYTSLLLTLKREVITAEHRPNGCLVFISRSAGPYAADYQCDSLPGL